MRCYTTPVAWTSAQAVCAQGEAHKVDGDDLHGVLYNIAVARGDDAGAAAELQWADGKPGERTLLIEAGQEAFARGQVRRGLALFDKAAVRGQDFGLGDIFSAPNAYLLYDLGRLDLARQSLARVPAGQDSADYRFSLAEFGDASRVPTALLAAALTEDVPANTLLTQVYAAEQRAAAGPAARPARGGGRRPAHCGRLLRDAHAGCSLPARQAKPISRRATLTRRRQSSRRSSPTARRRRAYLRALPARPPRAGAGVAACGAMSLGSLQPTKPSSPTGAAPDPDAVPLAAARAEYARL